MKSVLTTLLLAPAALIAAADSTLDAPAAAQELGELEQIFTTGIPQALREHYSEEIVQAYMHGSEAEVTDIEECRALIARYRETGDARTASPQLGVTLLHLACLAKKAELARALLAAGADPNRGAGVDVQLNHPDFQGATYRQWDDSPLVASVRDDMPGMPPPDAATCRRLIDMLVAAGADVRGEAGACALLACAKGDFEGAEDIALHLLQLGTDPRNIRGYGWASGVLAECGMPRLLEAVLQGGLFNERADQCYEGMLRLLLENDHMDEGQRACVALLLRQGAELHRPDGNGVTPSDLIHARPALLAWLTEQGFEVPRTPRDFDESQLTAHMGEYACAHALCLLWLTDAPRTLAAIQALPMWQHMDTPRWPATAGERSLFRALFRVNLVRLPADWIVEQAARLDAAGHPVEAHELLHLLMRLDRATVAPLIEQLCRDERPSHAAAGWSLRLQLAGFSARHQCWPYDVQCWPDRDDAARVKRLAVALSTLVSLSDRYEYLLDFSEAHENEFFFELNIPSVFTENHFHLSEERSGTPEEEAELINTLRGLGEPAAADFVQTLFRLRHEYERGQAAAADDDIGPDEDYEEPGNGNAAQERITTLGLSPEADRHAFAIEAALGRLLWELYQKNTKLPKEHKMMNLTQLNDLLSRHGLAAGDEGPVSPWLSDEAVQELARAVCASEAAPELMPPQAAMLLEILAEHGELAAMEVLLQRGWLSPDVQEDGFTVLSDLVEKLDDDDEEAFTRLAPAIALLLRHGADALTPQPDNAGSSPADHIHHNLRLEEYLRGQGIEVGRTPRRLRAERAQLADDLVHLPLHAHPPVEDLRARFDTMASLLRKPAGSGWVGEMAPMRVPPLLAQADPARAAEVIMPLPAWQEAEGHALDHLCRAVQLATRLTLPPDWIVATAGQLHGRGQEFAAHEILSLLGREASDAALAESLCTDARPAFAAAAWGARLRLAGLSTSQLHSFPLAFDEGSKLHHRAFRAFSALCELGAGTFYESGFRNFDIAAGHPKAKDLDELCRLLAEYGQESAADDIRELDALRRLGKRRRTPEQSARLAELESPAHTVPASFAVEIAVAKFLWEHADTLNKP